MWPMTKDLNRQPLHHFCCFHRLARINSYVIALFVTLYFLSYFRITKFPIITITSLNISEFEILKSETSESETATFSESVSTASETATFSESASTASETATFSESASTASETATFSETDSTVSETAATASETESTATETAATASETESTATETAATASITSSTASTAPITSSTAFTASETASTGSKAATFSETASTSTLQTLSTAAITQTASTASTASETGSSASTASETASTASETASTASETASTASTASETTSTASTPSETATTSEKLTASTRTLENEKAQQNPEILHVDEIEIACKIPELDAFHESVKKFTGKDIDPPKCQEKYPPVFKLGLNFTVVRESNTTEWKDCCYKEIYRSTEDSTSVDSDVSFSKKCTPMPTNVTEIPTTIQFIGIYCNIPEHQRKALNLSTESPKEQLIDAFAFVPEDKEEMNKPVNDSSDKLNVVIFGIDGVSRMNFLRIMPQVHKYLTQNLSAISMESYVKVGARTFHNVVAALAAMNASHVQQSCEKEKFFDDCPFLWKKFAAEGYRTSYSEDSPWMAAFNYIKRGFKRPPVDYYFRPVAHVLDKQLGSDKRRNARICFGPRISIEVVLNYMQKMAVAMNQRNQRYFQFTWATSLTHDYLNLGIFGQNATLETLQWFQKEGHLNKTLLIVMSDHGFRFGGFRKTKQGQVEESLPFLYFVLPDWFKQKYPAAIENMKKNTKRLTTPFDLHETLLDILNTTNLEEKEMDKRNEMLDLQRQKNEVPRGISMFLPSPPERTCEMAGIPEHFCACHETEDLETKSSVAQQAVNYAVYEINSFISKYIDCSFLTLKSISSAYTFNRTQTAFVNTQEQAVTVLFETSPGDAEFEGTVIRHVQTNKTENWKFSGVSRVNMYGNDSHCISDKEMKIYCYCKDLLE